MNTKTFLATFAATILAAGLFAQTAAPSREDMRQALKGAVDKAQASLSASGLDKNLALSVFFIEGDSAGYAETRVRDAVMQAGLKYVVPNDDDNRLLQKIYTEMAFDERKEGMVNPKTVEKINGASLTSTQALIFGNIWTVVDNDRYTLVELSLGIYSVKTKEFLWAGSFDCRYYKPGKAPEIGLVDLPVTLREILQNSISTKLADSIKAQPKLASVATVAILPLVGDETAAVSGDGSLKAPPANAKGSIVIDGYITHIVVDALSRTSLMPKNVDLQTRQEARRALRDSPKVADTMLFGAVRGLDLHCIKGKFGKQGYEAIVELQLSIEEAGTQNVLWSDTILDRQYYELPPDPRSMIRLIIGAVALIVFLIVFGKILRAATRVR